MRKLKSLFVILALVFVFGIHNNLHAQDEAVISVTYYLDGNKVKPEDHLNYAFGDSLTIGTRPFEVGENSKFLFWTINDAIRRDLPESFGARVKSTTHLKAYFISSDKKAAAFVDSNLKLIEIQYLEESAPILPENDPDKALSAFDGWGLIGSYETKVTNPTLPSGSRLADVYVARYLIDKSKSITINVDGTDKSYLPNGEVELTSTKTNVVWKDDKGTIIGYGSPYVFSAIGNMTITSHEGESVQYYTTISSPHEIRQGYTSFVGKHNLPESYDIIEYGFKYYDTTKNDYVKAVSNIINGETNEFLMSFPSVANKNNIQAYVVYAEDNNDIKTIESDYRVHEYTGSFTSAVPNWVKGYETNVKDSFVKAYKESGFKNTPSFLQALELPKARVVLYQDIGSEGTIFLNEREGKPLVVTDPLAVNELRDLISSSLTDEQKGILIGIIEQGGETHYVTDRFENDGIFHIVNNEPVYTNTKVGIGMGTFEDIMWIEYTKAYKLSMQFMQSLGLPRGSVVRDTYTTKDLDETGRYLSDETTSLKTYTKQQFENGWIIQARMQPRNTDGTLVWGHQLIQHAAAPILTDMYNHVIDIEDNDKLNVTGAPVSLEFNVNGVRYQNFEYGYVKLSVNDTVTFIPDLVVDSKGTEMDRRVGASLTWDNIRIDSRPEETTYEKASNHEKYMITWERLRVAQNFRETVGEMIRDTNRPEVSRTFTTSLNRVVSRAPQVGVWMTFASGEGSSLGGTRTFIYHKYWYDKAYELAPSFNTAIIVDDGPHTVDGVEFRLGRPSSKFITHDNRHFQLFENGLAFINNKQQIEYRYGLDKAANFINYYQLIKEKFAEVGVTFP